MDKIINDRIETITKKTHSGVFPSVWEVNVSSDTDGKEYTVLLNWKNIAFLAITGRCVRFPEDFFGLLVMAGQKGCHGFSRSMLAEAIRDSEYYYLSTSENIVEILHSGLWERKVEV